jgi:ADP-heptose:LPS heptosyltransferase
VLIGGPQDREVALDFIRQADHTNAQVLCGEPFAKTAAVIARTACFVGVDSGLTHIAGVMHVPTVAIENLRTVMWLPRYNPNAVILTEAKNCLCSADRGRDCYYEIGGIRYLRCMIDIPQENIKKAITETLQKND